MDSQIVETATVEQPQTIVASPKRKGVSAVVRGILCILLAVVLIADTIVLSVTIAVRTFITEDNIEKIIDQTDYMTIPITIDNIRSNLYEMFFIAFANSSTDTVDIYRLAEDTEFEEFVAEQIYSYASFILYDTRLEGIDSDVIMEFYDENSDKIDRAFNVTYSRNEIREIIEGQEYLFDKLTNNEIEASIPMIKLIRFVVSPAALIILGILAMVLVAFIGVLSRNVGVPIAAVGISLTTAGLIGTITSCLAIWGTIGVPLEPAMAAGIIWQGVVSAVMPNIFTMFLYILIPGILLILTAGFIGQIRRNLQNAKINKKSTPEKF